MRRPANDVVLKTGLRRSSAHNFPIIISRKDAFFQEIIRCLKTTPSFS